MSTIVVGRSSNVVAQRDARFRLLLETFRCSRIIDRSVIRSCQTAARSQGNVTYRLLVRFRAKTNPFFEVDAGCQTFFLTTFDNFEKWPLLGLFDRKALSVEMWKLF